MKTEMKSIEKKIQTFPAKCDIYKDTGMVVLVLEMPGVNQETLTVRVEGDRLHIDGKKVIPKADGNYQIHEIQEGDFHQEYTIDNTIDRESIEANIKNGLVTIKLVIKESEKPRIIKVLTK